MQIIELTELQFKNYSRLHSKKNYKQSVEYAKLKQYDGYTPHYLGLIDDMNNVHAATLLLGKSINNKHKYGYVPNGYLINHYNIDLVQIFTNELKVYLKKENFIYIRINPSLNYQTYTSDFILKENNSGIINEFKKIGYELIPNTTKYKMMLKTDNIKSTYKNFKRSLRRTINDCLKKGIIVYQATTPEDKQAFLNIIDTKERYQHMIELFNNNNNRLSIYLAKIDPNTYINNYRYLLKKEQINNEILNQKLKNPNVQKTTKLIEKKMTSDKLINSYKNEMIIGTEFAKKYPNSIIISGVAIIKNEKNISFVKEGYLKEFKNIRSIPLIKWEIIKQQINNGYKIFDLGDVTITNNQITKAGFNGNIIEYSNSFDLVINDLLYKLNGYAKKKYHPNNNEKSKEKQETKK